MAGLQRQRRNRSGDTNNPRSSASVVGGSVGSYEQPEGVAHMPLASVGVFNKTLEKNNKDFLGLMVDMEVASEL